MTRLALAAPKIELQEAESSQPLYAPDLPLGIIAKAPGFGLVLRTRVGLVALNGHYTFLECGEQFAQIKVQLLAPGSVITITIPEERS